MFASGRILVGIKIKIVRWWHKKSKKKKSSKVQLWENGHWPLRAGCLKENYPKEKFQKENYLPAIMPTSEKMASAKCCLKEYYLYNIIQIILAKLTNHRRGKPNYPKGKDQEDNTQQLNKDKKNWPTEENQIILMAKFKSDLSKLAVWNKIICWQKPNYPTRKSLSLKHRIFFRETRMTEKSTTLKKRSENKYKFRINLIQWYHNRMMQKNLIYYMVGQTFRKY